MNRTRPFAHIAAPSRAWLHAGVALAIAFMWLAATAWERPLTLPDEGRYVGVALEMLRSGHWAVPTLAGLPFFHKPPLFYWMTAAAMSLFGVTEWAARIASLLGATAGAGALYALTRRWSNGRLARLALLVLLTHPLWFMGAQFANMDMLVAGCISATIALLAHAAMSRENGRPWRRSLLAAWLCAALGVLAKGLIGAVIPALVMLVWLGARRQWRGLLALLWPPGIALFLAVALPWFVLMQRTHDGFFHYFVIVQHFQRFAEGGFNNVEPLWFYPVVLALLSLPWFGWLLRLTQKDTGGGCWKRVAQQPLSLLMWVWLGVVLAFFSLPQSKLIGYVLPAVPPAAFLMAQAASSVGRKALGVTAIAAALLCLGVVAGLMLHPLPSNRALARAYAAKHQAGEPLVFVDRYGYDFGFYAGNSPLPTVVDDWHGTELRKHDNWRKELADAATFAPEIAALRLIDAVDLPARLCEAPVSWVVAPSIDAQKRFAFLALAEAVKAGPNSTLWRVDIHQPALASSLGCR